MEHVGLDITVITIIGILLLSKFLNDSFKIPLPHSLIALSFVIHKYYPNFLNLSANDHFDEILLLLIPLILLIDALHLKWEDIKKHGYSIFYLAFIAILFSVIVGSMSFYYGILGVGVSMGVYVSLFAIVNATDAVSVGSIFASFKNVAHDKKVLIEGESLGNDAVTFSILMLIGIPWAVTGSFDFSTLPSILFIKVGSALLIGAIIGYIFYYLTALFKEEKEEFLIMLGVAFASFTLAEIFHLAGIFSLIVAVITFKTLIDKHLLVTENCDGKGQLSKYKMFNRRVTTKERHKNTITLASNFAFIGIVILFVAMSEMINLEMLLKYKLEIMIVFLITTVTRFFSIYIYMLLSKQLKIFTEINKDGFWILSLAGIKGGLSIIMVHSLKNALGEQYADLMLKVEAIVIGVIILSIFIYGLSLLFYMLRKEKREANS